MVQHFKKKTKKKTATQMKMVSSTEALQDPANMQVEQTRVMMTDVFGLKIWYYSSPQRSAKGLLGHKTGKPKGITLMCDSNKYK